MAKTFFCNIKIQVFLLGTISFLLAFKRSNQDKYNVKDRQILWKIKTNSQFGQKFLTCWRIPSCARSNVPSTSEEIVRIGEGDRWQTFQLKKKFQSQVFSNFKTCQVYLKSLSWLRKVSELFRSLPLAQAHHRGGRVGLLLAQAQNLTYFLLDIGVGIFREFVAS